MIEDKLKFLQGYVRVRLTGYAPERFLNLCSKHEILIWDLLFREEQYEFCLRVRDFRQLKPILRKTRTQVRIVRRTGLPFLLYRYRKRKIFFFGILLCGGALYVMSLFIWNIQVEGNLHRTDSAVIKLLEENQVYQGSLKSRLDCEELEELLRSSYEDVIWASVKIQGTRLVIDLQENLVANQSQEAVGEGTPSDLTADKDAVIYSIITRRGTPLVEAGSTVEKGALLVEGKIPIYNDSGELVRQRYCYAEADILGSTSYLYEDAFSMEYEDKAFTGKEKTRYTLLVFQKPLHLYFPWQKQTFPTCQKITTEKPLKIGKSFYLPIVLCKEVSKEYNKEKKTYTKAEAEALAQTKLLQFCKNLEEKGVQITENRVMITVEGQSCTARGELKVIEPIGTRQPTEITEFQ